MRRGKISESDIDWMKVNRGFGFKVDKSLFLYFLNESLYPVQKQILSLRLAENSYTLKDCEKQLGIPWDRAAAIDREAWSRLKIQYLSEFAKKVHAELTDEDLKIEKLEATKKAIKTLKALGCKSIADFRVLRRSSLSGVKGCGKKTVNDIKSAYKQKFGMDMED